jgi:uracil phosphoribosyltransferase
VFTVINHPLAGHLLAQLRDKTTEPSEFREISRKLTSILALEATRDFATVIGEVEAFSEVAQARRLATAIAAVPVLRAGLSMLEAVTDLFPNVAVGYLGLERNEQTRIATSYYQKLPPLKGKCTLLLDPMLATGGSAIQAVDTLKNGGAEDIRMLSVVAAPEGVKALAGAHPDVTVFAAALDRCLNSEKFILPGLGDFGDRLYGTN